jgi:pseudouridine-5'-phosphate glycosidase/pseudouridine kinase
MQPDQQSSMTTSSVQSTPSESASTTSISVSTSSDDAGQYFQPFSGPPTVLVAGALAVDYSCDFAPSIANITSPQLQTSNLARITQSLGGVAHNVAKAMHYLGTNVKLLSVVGNDLDGRSAIDQLEHEDMRTDGIEECSDESARTARYVAINDSKKDLVVAMADMDLINTHGEQYFKEVWAPELQRKEAQWFVADANWEPRILHNTFQTASDAGCYTAFEPVSVTKGSRMFKRALSSSSSPLNELKELQVFPLNTIDLMAPNAMELAAIHSTAREEGLLESQEWWKIIDELGIPSSGARSRLVNSTSEALVDQGLPQQAIQLLPFVPCIITKLGADGVLLTMMLQHGDPRLHSKEAAPYIISRNHNSADAKVAGVYMRLFPPVSKVADEQIVSVNGVGDTFLGALVAGMQQTGSGVEHLIDFAQEAAVLSLQSVESVNPELMGQELRLGEMARVERPTYQMSRR